MTRLERAVSRETPSAVRDRVRHRSVVATMTREGLTLRLKGTRTTYGPVPWEKLYVYAARLHADAAVAAKRAKRKHTRNLLRKG